MNINGYILEGNGVNLAWRQLLLPIDPHPLQLDTPTVLACILAFLIAAVSNAVGVGGGSFFVLLVNLLLGFSIKSSAAISQAIITGGAAAAVAVTAFKRHPLDASRLLIDWQQAALLLPPLLLGVSAGVQLNRILPGLCITFTLLTLLLFLGTSTLRKAWRIRNQELAQRVAHEEEVVVLEQGNSCDGGLQQGEQRLAPTVEQSATSVTTTVLSALPVHPTQDAACLTSKIRDSPSFSTITVVLRELDDHPTTVPMCGRSSCTSEEVNVSPLVSHQIMQPESHHVSHRTQQQHHPTTPDCTEAVKPAVQYSITADGRAPVLQNSGKAMVLGSVAAVPSRTWGNSVALLQLVVLWCSFMALQVLKSSIDPCTWLFIQLYTGQAALCAAATVVAVVQHLHVHTSSQDLGPLSAPLLLQHVTPTTPKHELRRVISSCGLAALGGCVAGLTGLGGGMVLGPLMLHMGLHPQATAATSGVTVLFSSSSAALTFLLSGRLNVPYAAVLTVSCMAGAVMGIFVISRAVRRSGAASLVALILAGIMLLSALLAAWAAAQGVVEQLNGTHPSHFHSPCGVSG